MYKEILIAIDGSELANRALAHGLKLANEVKARVTIVTVTAPWSALDLAHEARLRKPDPIHQFEEMAAASAKVILDAAAQTAKMAGVACELVHVPEQHPAEGIIATAEKRGCDLIVMASHGRRALGRLLLGSQVNGGARTQQDTGSDRAVTWRSPMKSLHPLAVALLRSWFIQDSRLRSIIRIQQSIEALGDLWRLTLACEKIRE
jgi:nucleotide-binding universal stress UspA family protein